MSQQVLSEVVIETKVGTDGVESGVEKGKRSLRSLAQAASEAGREGSAGLSKMGDGLDAAAPKVERAATRITAAIKKATAESKALEAGEKGSGRYFESLAQSMGVSADQIRPYIRELDAVRARQAEAAATGEQYTAQLSRLGTAAAYAGAALAAVAGVGALKGAIDVLDQLDDLAEKSGIAARELSALRYAGETTGTPFEALSTGVGKFTKNVAAAAGGAKEQAALFDTLGLKLKGADGALRSTDAMLMDLADTFASFRDSPEKMALAFEAFGKTGDQLIPVLNQGADGIKALREEGEKLGAVYGGDLAKQAADFNDNLTKIRLSAEGARVAIAGELLPTLNTLAEEFLRTQTAGTTFAQDVGKALRVPIEAATVLSANVGYVFKGVGNEIGGIAAQVSALARLDFKGFSAISDAMKEDAARARKEIDDLSARMLRLRDDMAGAGRGAANDPRILGSVGSISTQVAAWREAAPVIKKAGDAAKEEKTQFDALNASISQRLALMDEEIEQGRKLSDGEKFILELQRKLTDESVKLTEAERAKLEARLELVRVQQPLYEQVQRDIEFSKVARTETEKTVDAIFKEAEATREKLRLQLVENEGIGRTAVEIAQLEAARLRDAAASKEQQAANLALIPGMQAAAEEARNTARDLRDLADAKVAGEVKKSVLDASKAAAEAQKKAAEEAAQEWKRSADQIEQSLLNAAMQGGKSMREYLEGVFRGFAIKVAFSPITTPLSQIAASLTSGTSRVPGIGGAGGGGVLDTFSDAFGLERIINNGGIAGVGSPYYGLATSGFGQAVGLSNAAPIVGNNVSAFMPAGSQLTALGSALPYIGAGLAVLSMLAKSGETRQGAGYQVNDGRAVLGGGPSGGAINQAVETKLVQDTFDSINTILKGVGSAASVAAFQAGLESSTKGRGAVFAGGSLSTGASFGQTYEQTEYNRTLTPEQAATEFGKQLQQATVEALKAATDIPASIRKTLEGSGDAASLLSQVDAMVTSVAALKEAVKVLPFNELNKLLTFDGFNTLVTTLGGLDTASNKLSSYYAGYFTEAERTANLTRVLTEQFSALGFELPKSRDELRALVEANMALGDAGAKTVAGLLNLGDSFAQLVPQASSAAASLEGIDAALAKLREGTVRTAEDIARSIMGLEANRSALLADLMEARGDTEGAAAARRTIDTKGMTDAEIAIYDYNAALRAQITAITDLRGELKGLEDGLADIMGTAAKTPQEVLASMMEELKSIEDFRWNLGDSINAAWLNGMTPANRVAALQKQESDLFAYLPNAEDPVATAQRLQQTILDRIAAEIEMRDAANQAQLDALGKQKDFLESLKSATAAMRSTVDGLRLGGESALTPGEQLRYAQTKFDDAVARALGGDLAAFGDVQSYGQSLVGAGRDIFASSPEAVRIFNAVTSTMDQLIGMGAGVDPQIAAIDKQTQALEEIESTSILSLEQSRMQVDALTELDGKLFQIQESRQAAVDKQTEVAREQIAVLKSLVEKQQIQIDQKDAQLGQTAAVALQQKELLQKANALLAAISESTRIAETAPPMR